MKSKLLMAAAVCAVVGLTSCTSQDAKLAGELVGTWKGNTTEMMKGKKDKPDNDGKQKPDNGDMRRGDDRGDRGRGDGGEMSCTPTLTFVRTDGTNGGTLTLSGDYTVSKGVESVTAATPVKATVNGTISATGTWMVKEGDEIVMTLDPSKTVIDVDTTSLSLSYARITDAPQDSLVALKDKIAGSVAGVVKPMIAAKVQKVHKFDDVKITGNTMTLEAGHNKLTFTKQ